MHRYHGTELHTSRLNHGTCRCASTKITYELAELVVGGRIRNPGNLEEILTTDPIGLQGMLNIFIYAVSEDYRIRVAPDGGDRAQLDIAKHETLFHNADVRAAGEIYIKDGCVIEINDYSGSYQTRSYLENDPNFARAVLRAITLNKIPVGPVLLAQLADYGGGDEL